MSVYVDNSSNKVGRMKFSHMIADGVDELHAMADTIGVPRKYFQDTKYPHYDICQSKKYLAVKAGAIPVGYTKLLKIRKGVK